MDNDELARRFRAALGYGGFTGIPALAEHERIKREGGLSKATLYNVQQGRRTQNGPLLSPGEMTAIAEACGLPPEFFWMSWERAAALERAWNQESYEHVGPGTYEGYFTNAFALLEAEYVGDVFRVDTPPAGVDPNAWDDDPLEVVIEKKLDEHLESRIEDVVRRVLGEMSPDATRVAFSATRGVAREAQARAVADESGSEVAGDTRDSGDASQESAPTHREAKP